MAEAAPDGSATDGTELGAGRGRRAKIPAAESLVVRRRRQVRRHRHRSIESEADGLCGRCRSAARVVEDRRATPGGDDLTAEGRGALSGGARSCILYSYERAFVFRCFYTD